MKRKDIKRCPVCNKMGFRWNYRLNRWSNKCEKCGFTHIPQRSLDESF